MKYLHLLSEWLESLLGKKQSQLKQLNLKKEYSQKILSELQHSAFLWGEARWQTLLAASLEALAKSGQHKRRLQVALQQADDLIDEAQITKKVRMALLDQVRRHVVLEEDQIEHYETIRRKCLSHQTSLHELENKIDSLVDEGRQIINEPLPPKVTPLFNLNSRTEVEILKPYPLKTLQARFSDSHIRDWVKGEGDAREVYQNLSQELLQKSATEKMGEDVKRAKNTLQHRVEKLETKVDHCRKEMTIHNRRAIEHRSQTLLAHANKIESLSLSLATIIHLLEPHLKSPCLFNLLTEAQTMQKSLNSNASGTDLQSKLLAMNHYRGAYEKSITSVWGTLFNRGQLKYQKQLHADLQTAIIRLVIPVCGFNDKNTVITPEKVKQLQKTVDKLAVQQGIIAQEQVKIDQIKNIFQPSASSS